MEVCGICEKTGNLCEVEYNEEYQDLEEGEVEVDKAIKQYIQKEVWSFSA